MNSTNQRRSAKSDALGRALFSDFSDSELQLLVDLVIIAIDEVSGEIDPRTAQAKIRECGECYQRTKVTRDETGISNRN